MLQNIISRGREGAEHAAWRAAKTFGVALGGWKPGGCSTEDTSQPEAAQECGAAELRAHSATDQTDRNVQTADATLWFGATTTLGAQETVGACYRFTKPCMVVYPCASFEPWHVAAWIGESRISTLNMAGNCEEDEPGIEDLVERFLGEVLQQLGHERV